MSERVAAIVTISNRLGLHARPAMTFVERAMAFPCDVKVRRTDQDDVVDGKSIMQMMMLAATQGTQVEIITEGECAAEALEALRQLVDSKFDEE